MALTASDLPAEAFAPLVRYEEADMRAIPPHLPGYDFGWSAYAFEHHGSPGAGIDFVVAALKPGGLAAHTTEYNLANGWLTRDHGATVVSRKRDLERLFRRAAALGCATRATWAPGGGVRWMRISTCRPIRPNGI